jgi:hypothetical protein
VTEPKQLLVDHSCVKRWQDFVAKRRKQSTKHVGLKRIRGGVKIKNFLVSSPRGAVTNPSREVIFFARVIVHDRAK